MHITSTAMMAYIQVRHRAICELWSPSTSDSSSVVFIILTEARLSTALFIATEMYSWARRLSSIWYSTPASSWSEVTSSVAWRVSAMADWVRKYRCSLRSPRVRAIEARICVAMAYVGESFFIFPMRLSRISRLLAYSRML